MAEKPKILKTNPSNTKLGLIYVVEEEESNEKKGQNNPNFKKKLTYSDATVDNYLIEQDDVLRVNT